MDILATEALQDSEICLMSRTKPKLDRWSASSSGVHQGEQAARRRCRPRSTAARRSTGADYVIVMIQVGGVDAFGCDYEIPLKYGVDQCIGDSLGPGGIFRGLRTIPVLVDIVARHGGALPRRDLLNYANPMGANCLALGTASANVQFIGLCHGVQTTLDLIAATSDVPKDQIDFLCAGINHMAWFLSLRDKRDGRDLYPLLRANMREARVLRQREGPRRGHAPLRLLHDREHRPPLRVRALVPQEPERALDLYCDQPDFGGASGAYYKYCDMLAEKYKDVDYLGARVAEDQPPQRRVLLLHPRGAWRRTVPSASTATSATTATSRTCRRAAASRCRCSSIARAAPGARRRPAAQCAALNQSNVTVQQLAVEAALTGDPEYAMQAIALDPLTSAVCTLEESANDGRDARSREAVAAAVRGQSLVAYPEVKISAGTRGVDVPTDPALAIANRFGPWPRRRREGKQV